MIELTSEIHNLSVDEVTVNHIHRILLTLRIIYPTKITDDKNVSIMLARIIKQHPFEFLYAVICCDDSYKERHPLLDMIIDTIAFKFLYVYLQSRFLQSINAIQTNNILRYLGMYARQVSKVTNVSNIYIYSFGLNVLSMVAPVRDDITTQDDVDIIYSNNNKIIPDAKRYQQQMKTELFKQGQSQRLTDAFGFTETGISNTCKTDIVSTIISHPLSQEHILIFGFNKTAVIIVDT